MKLELALLLVPAVAGCLALVVHGTHVRRGLLVVAAVVHAVLTACAWWQPLVPPDDAAWMALDAAGLTVLTGVSALFLAAAPAAVRFLRDAASDTDDGAPTLGEGVFVACLLVLLADMTLVCLGRHFGLLWIGVEATTLVSAPIIYYRRTPAVLEATWKYLLICSVGIALALLGNMFLTVSAQFAGGDAPLSVGGLFARAQGLNVPWLKAAFILLLVGYGTKMGLAPMHTWMPETYGSGPFLFPLLSTAMINCVFLAILRAHMLCAAAGEAAFAQDLWLALGFFSITVAAVFILGQVDFTRMLAYSSVEHMGVLALGMGFGGAAVGGAIYHTLNHAAVKGFLFLTVGAILAVRGTRRATDVTGLSASHPATAALWLAGFFAITGLPPFGTFFSEWIILREAFSTGQYWAAGTMLAVIAVIFLGMASIMPKMTFGTNPDADAPAIAPKGYVWPAAALAAAALFLGVAAPDGLMQTIASAASAVLGEGVRP